MTDNPNDQPGDSDEPSSPVPENTFEPSFEVDPQEPSSDSSEPESIAPEDYSLFATASFHSSRSREEDVS